MNAGALITELESKGVHLASHGDRLRLDAPRGVLTSALLRKVRVRKDQLLAVTKIREALAGRKRLTGKQLLACTGLSGDDLYGALDELYGARELQTNPEGLYWIETSVN